MDGISSGLCPVAGFGNSSFEFTARELVNKYSKCRILHRNKLLFFLFP
jgi:hypothetical protein